MIPWVPILAMTGAGVVLYAAWTVMAAMLWSAYRRHGRRR